MISSNPFRSRASEDSRDDLAFVRTFAAEALDLLPEPPWTGLLVLRSAPGAGKTSLMRLFTADSLATLCARARPTDPLYQRLRELEVVDDAGPLVAGVLLNLERDYRALLDLGYPAAASERLLYRLLDARIMAACVRAVIVSSGLSFPADASRVRLVGSDRDSSAARAVDKLGGRDAADLLTHARTTEDAILNMLDVLGDDTVDPVTGSAELLSLRALSDASFEVDGAKARARPLIMFDDGHRLAPQQRSALIDRLRDRSLGLPRWYAERLSALSADDLIGGTPGRDHRVVCIEDLFRGIRRSADSPPKMTPLRFSNMLVNVADRRASPILTRYTGSSAGFADLIDADDDEVLADREDDLADLLLARIRQLAGTSHRYDAWVEGASQHTGRARIARLAEVEVLIERDKVRTQGELFEVELSAEDVVTRGSAAVREAAFLRLALTERLPYYSGVDVLTKLASANVEQFLGLCGDMFADMLADLAVGRHPMLDARRQDRILRRASNRYYNDLRIKVPDGHLVQRFVDAVAAMASYEADKPTIPYPPGVTGTALTMRDRDRLMDASRRDSIPGSPQLYQALANAVAHNVVWIDLDYSVKGDHYMVIYLNRLLCPRFGLHLGKGGFRERSLQDMSLWMLADSTSPKVERLL